MSLLSDEWLLSEYVSAIQVFAQGGAKALVLNATCANWEQDGWVLRRLCRGTAPANRG